MGAELEQQRGGVPELRYDPSTEMTAEDVALPKFKVGQSMTPHVKRKLIEEGALFTETNKDDPEPVQLDQPARVFILDFFKGKSLSVDGELDTWRFDDPEAPSEAWTTYNYVIAIPGADTIVPYRWLMTRTQTPTAKQLNLMLQKAALGGPTYHVPFEVTTRQTSNNKGEWYIAQVRRADEPATDGEVKTIDGMLALAGRGREQSFTGSGVDEEVPV